VAHASAVFSFATVDKIDSARCGAPEVRDRTGCQRRQWQK